MSNKIFNTSKEDFLKLYKKSGIEEAFINKNDDEKALFFEGCSERLKKFLIENNKEGGIVSSSLIEN
jgi:hypothetical protein